MKLSAREAQALVGMADVDDDFGYLSFADIAVRSGLDIRHVRRTVRALSRKGLAEYGFGLWSEDGKPAGSGYRITAVGRGSLPPTFDEAVS